MKQEDYRSCMSAGLKGKRGLSKEQRKAEFCITSQICSGKSSSREEAITACNAQPCDGGVCLLPRSQPKAPKASARRARVSRGSGGMRLVLLTSTDCPPCVAAKKYLKDKMDKGLIEELNVQKSDEAADLAAKYHFMSVPKLLVLDDEGKPFSELQITDEEITL